MRFSSLAFWLVTPATLGLMLPDFVRAADGTVLPIRDVALSDDSALAGTVIDCRGQPIPGVPVLLLQAGKVAARTVTSADGRLRIANLPGGLYEVSAAGGSELYRVWQRTAAPPRAAAAIVIVAGDEAIRGQSPRTGFFRSDAFLISAAVIGAVLIPIFISAARRESPPGS